jgi:hypothetical protein
MSNTNGRVSIPVIGSQTCGQLQNDADNNDIFPDDCGRIQTITLATSDPCQCKDFDGSDCDPPGFTNTQTCNLCGDGNKRIGDPDRIIQSGILTGTKCITAFDDNAYGAFNSVCSTAQTLIQQWCGCVDPGQSTKQCIALEQDRCSPQDSDDVCCAGSCKYLNSKGGYRCTERNGDTPPASYAPPIAAAPAFAVCFSGDMQVTTADKGNIAMKDLEVGDKILTGANKFETVYSFGHRHETMKTTYLQIHTDQSSPLELSADHMVFVQKNHAVPAASLKIGDALLRPDGELTTIKRIHVVTRYGAYAPFTFSGSVVVNGIVGSSYVGLQGKSEYLQLGESLPTPLTLQWLAHAFEAPHRLAYRLGFVNEQYTAKGVSQWVDLPHKFGNWLVQQNGAMMSLFVVPAFAVFGFVWCLEQYLLTSVVLVGLLLVTRSKSSAKL